MTDSIKLASQKQSTAPEVPPSTNSAQTDMLKWIADIVTNKLVNVYESAKDYLDHQVRKIDLTNKGNDQIDDDLAPPTKKGIPADIKEETQPTPMVQPTSNEQIQKTSNDIPKPQPELKPIAPAIDIPEPQPDPKPTVPANVTSELQSSLKPDILEPTIDVTPNPPSGQPDQNSTTNPTVPSITPNRNLANETFPVGPEILQATEASKTIPIVPTQKPKLETLIESKTPRDIDPILLGISLSGACLIGKGVYDIYRNKRKVRACFLIATGLSAVSLAILRGNQLSKIDFVNLV